MESDIVQVDVPLSFTDSFVSVDGNWELVEKKGWGWDSSAVQAACAAVMTVEARKDILTLASQENPQETP